MEETNIFQTSSNKRFELSPTKGDVDLDEIDISVKLPLIDPVWLNGKKCDHCDRSFNTARGLKRHLRVHSKPESQVNSKTKPKRLLKPRKCKMCDKSFCSPASLRKHALNHTGEKPFECEGCSLKFKHEYGVKIHQMKIGDCSLQAKAPNLLSDSDIPTFTCEICCKMFHKEANLRNHMLIHSDHRPHKCSWCQKTFIRKDHLTRHIRTHTKEKPYSCPYCGNRYSQSESLKRHLKSNNSCAIMERWKHLKSSDDTNEDLETEESVINLD